MKVPFEARGVVLKIEGFERASWEGKNLNIYSRLQEWKVKQVQDPQSGQMRSERYIHVHSQKKEFFCTKLNVYPHAGIVATGNYSFPFQYQLPANIPGSFHERGSVPFGQGSG